MKHYFFYATLCVWMLASCSSSKIVNSWSASNAKASSSNILVLGLFGAKERSAKNEMEKELVNDLKKMNFNAVAASDVFSPTAFRGMTEQQAIHAMKDKGIQSVIIITLVDKNKEKRYVNNYYSGFRPGFWGYYSYYAPWGLSPYYNSGYTQTNTTYVFETNLYNLNNDLLVYSAQSETEDANNSVSNANSYARELVQDMRKKNVFSAS